MSDSPETKTEAPRGLSRKHLVATIPILAIVAWFGYLWFVSGVITSTAKYEDGSTREAGYASRSGFMTYRRSGKWVTFHRDGKKSGEGMYEDGEMVDGTWTYWDEQGNEIDAPAADDRMDQP